MSTSYKYMFLLAVVVTGCGAFENVEAPGDGLGEILSEAEAENADCDPFDYEAGGREGACDPLLSIREIRCEDWVDANMVHFFDCDGSMPGDFTQAELIEKEQDMYELCVAESYEFGIPSLDCINEASRGCGPVYSIFGPGPDEDLLCGGDSSLRNGGADPGL